VSSGRAVAVAVVIGAAPVVAAAASSHFLTASVAAPPFICIEYVAGGFCRCGFLVEVYSELMGCFFEPKSLSHYIRHVGTQSIGVFVIQVHFEHLEVQHTENSLQRTKRTIYNQSVKQRLLHEICDRKNARAFASAARWENAPSHPVASVF
jgi:putative Ca2+/H+ antiporter (TMEM165/GDT1 family)